MMMSYNSDAMNKRNIDYEQLSERTANCADLDIEEKYYQMVPYNPDDSDFDSCEGLTESEDSEDDQLPPCIMHVNSESTADSDKVKMDKQGNVEKMYNQDIEYEFADLDMVEQYYQMVPYNPDDSDFDWCKELTESEDSEDEQLPPCIMHVNSENTANSDKVKMDKHGNVEKMYNQEIEYDQPLEPAANFADLDMVEQYYQMVPYNPDDSDFEWPQGLTQSEDSGDEQVSTCITYVKSESNNDLDKVKMNKHGNAEKMHKQDIEYEQPSESAENCADLDIVEKYYQMVPYNSDDSDFEWHSRQTQSECGKYEETPKRAEKTTDSDIEEKYYKRTPYKAVDSNFEWHARQAQLEGGEYEETPKHAENTTDLDIEEKYYKEKKYFKTFKVCKKLTFSETKTGSSSSDNNSFQTLTKHGAIDFYNNTSDTSKSFQVQTQPEGGEYEQLSKRIARGMNISKDTSDLNKVNVKKCSNAEKEHKLRKHKKNREDKKERTYFKTSKNCKKLIFETNETDSSSSDDKSFQVQTQPEGGEYEQLSKRIARGMNISKDTSDLNKVNVKKCSNAEKMHKLHKHKKNREDKKERKYVKTSKYCKKMIFETPDSSSSDNYLFQTLTKHEPLVFYSNTSDTSSDNLNKDAELETFDPMSIYLNNLGQCHFSRNARVVQFTPPAYIAMPRYNNHQLLGDSQLLKFAEQFLEGKRCVTFTEEDCRRINYCVSGQTIEDLRQRLLRDECPLSGQVVMLIGTTDFVYGTKLEDMYESFDAILKILTQDSLRKIVLLNVPPVPILEHMKGYWSKFKSFNHFIRRHDKEGKIVALDIASPLTDMDGKSRLEYFDMTDLVHLNEDGFKLVKALLDILYFDKI